jgi:hypothetical protein
VATAAQIRKWARENDIAVPSRGTVPNDVKEQYFAANPEDLGASEDGRLTPVLDLDGIPTDPGPELEGTVWDAGETPPDVGDRTPKGKAKTRLKDKFKGAWTSGGGTASTSKRRSVKGRSKITDLTSSAFTIFAQVYSGGKSPMSRMLALQAPAAGYIAEDAIKKGGTVDRLLQPLAKTHDKADAITALIGPAIFTWLIQKDPQNNFPTYEKALRISLLRYAKLAGPALKKAMEEEKELMAELDASGIDDMIRLVFAEYIQEDPDGGD